MSMRRSWLAVAVAVAVAGCSGGSHTASPTTDAPPRPVTPSTSLPVRATAACRGALKNPATFVNALPTTVGAIHNIRDGPGNVLAWTWLYKGEPDRTFAAWCWRRDSGTYQSYVVGPGTPIFLNMRTDTRPSPGPMYAI